MTVNGTGFLGEMKVKFIKPPAALGFGYFVGDEAEFETKQADELVKSGYAVEIVEETEKPKKKK